MNNVKIGKKLILALTSGMYEDSRFIYREYIQNSADQIDIAIKEGLITAEEATIIISVDDVNRNIIIHDNATGIKADDVVRQLGDVGDSEKSGEDTKGFIGIGRLGGLAYCSKLVFSTSYKGEKIRTIMTWDADLLHKLIHDPVVYDDASQVIQNSFKVDTEKAEEDDHFFQVELMSVHKANDELLNIESIRDYLSMVAPIPYENLFYLSDKIRKEIISSNYPNLNEYKVIINNEQLFKAYRKSIYKVNKGSRDVTDTIHDLAFEEFRSNTNELLAWMWYGLSRFETKINKVGNPQRGLRLKCKNIQIGDDTTVIAKKFFKEDRGTHYFVGEIHAVHPDIRPNARRDYFVDSTLLREFEIKLKAFCSGHLHSLYHDASTVKNALKKEIELEELIAKYEEKNNEGFASNVEEEKLKDKIETVKMEVVKRTKNKQKIEEKAKEDEALKSSISVIEKNFKIQTDNDSIDTIQLIEKKKRYKTNQLSKLKKGERRVVKRIFEIIHKVLSEDLAEELTEKIYEELQK